MHTHAHTTHAHAGAHLQSLDATIKRLVDAGFEVRDNATFRKEAETARRRWLRSLVAQLDRRFPRIEVLSSLAELFQPELIPQRPDQLQQHGNNAIATLLSFYCPASAPAAPAPVVAAERKEVKETTKEKKARQKRAKDEAKEQGLTKKNLDARITRGDALDPTQLRGEWQVLRPTFARWRDEFDKEKAAKHATVAAEALVAQAAAARKLEQQAKSQRKSGVAGKGKPAAGLVELKAVPARAAPPADGKAAGEEAKAPEVKVGEAEDRIDAKSDRDRDAKEEREDRDADRDRHSKDEREDRDDEKERPPTADEKFGSADLINRFLSNPQYVQDFPNMAKLAAIALILPVSSVECERAFSFLNRCVLR